MIITTTIWATTGENIILLSLRHFFLSFRFCIFDAISFSCCCCGEKKKVFIQSTSDNKDRRKKRGEHYGSNIDMVQQKKATNVSSRRGRLVDCCWLLDSAEFNQTHPRHPHPQRKQPSWPRRQPSPAGTWPWPSHAWRCRAKREGRIDVNVEKG